MVNSSRGKRPFLSHIGFERWNSKAIGLIEDLTSIISASIFFQPEFPDSIDSSIDIVIQYLFSSWIMVKPRPLVPLPLLSPVMCSFTRQQRKDASLDGSSFFRGNLTT
jgi:hypothetical protein